MTIEPTDKEVLADAHEETHSGYAHDLLTTMLEAAGVIEIPDEKSAAQGPATVSDQDCDSLFRTLVLDEGWDVHDAREVYDAASTVVNAS